MCILTCHLYDLFEYHNHNIIIIVFIINIVVVILSAAQLLIRIFGTTDCLVNELRDPVDNGKSSIFTFYTSSVTSSLTFDQLSALLNMTQWEE